jgi:hypothetical protein
MQGLRLLTGPFCGRGFLRLQTRGFFGRFLCFELPRFLL